MRLLKRKKKKVVRRRKHYLDEAPLQLGNNAVYLVRCEERMHVMILAAAIKFSNVVAIIARTLGETKRFEVERIVSGHFAVTGICEKCYTNLDGRVFNDHMEVVRLERR